MKRVSKIIKGQDLNQDLEKFPLGSLSSQPIIKLLQQVEDTLIQISSK
jgi:hypothetical protein